MTQDRTEMSEDDDEQQSQPLDLPSSFCSSSSSASSSTPNKSRNCISSSKTLDSQTFPDLVLEIVLENVLQFLDSRCDRNSASLVCKSWFRVEALTRSDVFIGNCYALSPTRLTQRFKRVRSVLLKGDDDVDDDDYFDEFDDGDEGDDGGLFRRRMILAELRVLCVCVFMYFIVMVSLSDSIYVLCPDLILSSSNPSLIHHGSTT